MERISGIIKIVLCVLLFASPCFSATYYVDYESGDDSNNGTSTGSPWKHAPWDSRATGTADSTSLSAGDSLLFNRGTIYDSDGATGDLFAVDDDGSPSNQIVVGAYGTGDPPIIVGGIAIDESQFELDSGVAGTNGVYEATNTELGLTGVTLQSFAEAASYDTFYPLADMYLEEGSSSLSRENRFYQANTDAGTAVYIRCSDHDTPVGKDMYAIWMTECFDLGSNDGYKFENLRIIGFVDDGFNCSAETASGYSIEFDTMQIWWVENGVRCMNGPIWIHDCDFRYNFWNSDGGPIPYGGYSDTSCLVEDTTIRRFENAMMFGDSSSHVPVIRRCFFMDAPETTPYDNAEHAIRLTTANMGLYLYRNIFYDCGNDCACFDNGVSISKIYVWNNTFVEDRASETGGSANNYTIQYNYTSTPQVDLRNNVYVQRQQFACVVGCSDMDWNNSSIDHNYYINNYDVFYTWRMSTNVYTLGDMQTDSGLDCGTMDDWSEVSLTDYFESVTYGDTDFLKPKRGGPLIDAGTEITIGENETDYDGKTVTGTFDIGAYEYGASSNNACSVGASGTAISVGSGGTSWSAGN